MFFSDKITLRKVTKTLDSYGDTVKGYTDTEVFADKVSVKRSEFYAANMAGIKVDTVFEVNAEDFNDQTEVTFGTKNYNVVRAYQKGLGKIELMCVQREVT